MCRACTSALMDEMELTSSRRFAPNGDLLRISTEARNVLVNPFQGEPLVMKAKVSVLRLTVVRILPNQTCRT